MEVSEISLSLALVQKIATTAIGVNASIYSLQFFAATNSFSNPSKNKLRQAPDR
jgi:hypothetical protein